MSIHAFFETLALGLQKNTIGVLSLASAILVHKWAEGLTLGLMYKKEGYGGKTAFLMVIFQGCINVLGLLVGSMLMEQGNFVMALFMSMSVGTFFYISLGEVLQEQLQNFGRRKLLMVILANCFIAFIVWFEKEKEASAEAAGL
jgi:solute carrier family 39 (zinc transporter), member 1/2/3